MIGSSMALGVVAMDAVERFRKRRAARLAMREDDEEKIGGGHGNTRLPFGLCQREGIAIEKGWGPMDAWAALEGKGYSARETYEELRKTGHVSTEETEGRRAMRHINEGQREEEFAESVATWKKGAHSSAFLKELQEAKGYKPPEPVKPEDFYRAFKKKYPNGTLSAENRTEYNGKPAVFVRFEKGGKRYTYRDSLNNLMERLKIEAS